MDGVKERFSDGTFVDIASVSAFTLADTAASRRETAGVRSLEPPPLKEPRYVDRTSCRMKQT
jgi:hypothetical protein